MAGQFDETLEYAKRVSIFNRSVRYFKRQVENALGDLEIETDPAFIPGESNITALNEVKEHIETAFNDVESARLYVIRAPDSFDEVGLDLGLEHEVERSKVRKAHAMVVGNYERRIEAALRRINENALAATRQHQIELESSRLSNTTSGSSEIHHHHHGIYGMKSSQCYVMPMGNYIIAWGTG